MLSTNRMSDSYPLLRLTVALLLMTLGGSAMYASVMVLEPVTREFATSRAVGSLLYATFMIGYGLGGVVMGRLADRVGILVPATIGSLALPAGLVMAANAGSIAEFCLALGLLCGFLGASFTFAPLVSDISHWFTARRGIAVGIVLCGSYAAGAIWPPILQHFFDAQGWRATLSDLALLTFCTMLPLSAILYRRPPIDASETPAGITRNPKRPLAMAPGSLQCLICAAGIGCCVAMATPQVHIVPFVIDLGHPAARGAEMLALMFGCGIISRVGSGWLSDRIGGLRTLLLGSMLQALVLFAFLTADDLLVLYAVSAAFGLSQGGIVPSYPIILRTFFPATEAGWRIGTTLLFTIVGMACGSWLAGALHDLTGSYTASFLGAITFNVLNLIIVGGLLKRAHTLTTTAASTSASKLNRLEG